MEYYLRFSSKTRQHKKRADCLHLSTKKPQPVVSGKISVFLGIAEAIVGSFCLSRVFSNLCITLCDDCTHGSAKPRNHGINVKIKRRMHFPPPPPLQKIRTSLILNLVLSRTARKCFKKMSRTCICTLSEQQKKEKDCVCSNRFYFFHLFVLLFSTRQASNRL